MKLSQKFIKATNDMCDFDNYVPAPYFRKEFKLDFMPQTAEITICGLGFYELYINGTNVTKGPLAPYISNPDDLCYYDNYNIAKLLNKGTNVIGVVLGNGFRNAYGGFIWDFEKAHCRGPVTFAMCFEATDGNNILEFEADESFKTHPSPILYNDLRMGYCYDARLELPGWSSSGFDDSAWENALTEKTPKGTPKICGAEPIAVTKELVAETVTHYDSHPYAHDEFDPDMKPFEDSVRQNVYVYDFGVNTAGVTKVKINGKPGQRITVRHGEHTVHGEFSVNTTLFQRDNETANERYRHLGQTDIFICKGGEEEFIPRFKYDGFRYAYVEGLEPEQATKDAVVCLVMNSDIKQRGSFNCSDETLNKLQQCTQQADLSNFYYFPTDCPHREKNGWTADAWLSSEHMLLNFTVENSLAEWMHNIRCAQRTDGALPGIVPTGGWGFEWGNGPVWDAICVQIPYYVYKYTGNKDIISDNASLIVRYLQYVSSKRDADGLTGFGLGDWCDPFQPETGYYSAPLEVVATIASYDISRKAAFLFDEICMYEESAYAASLANGLRKSIREHLIDFDTMTVKGNSQSSQALALAMDIFDNGEIGAAQQTLLDIIYRDGDINTCGVYGIRYIYHVLADMGEIDLACKIITCKERSCYGYWIANGATALWETFTTPYAHNTGSKNHHFFGDISSLFIQRIAGIMPNPDCDDASYYRIAPGFAACLDFAEATYRDAYVKWERAGGSIILTVNAPADSHGDIIIPDGYIAESDAQLEWDCDGEGCRIKLTLTKEQ